MAATSLNRSAEYTTEFAWPESLAPLISAMGDGRALENFCAPLAEYFFEAGCCKVAAVHRGGLRDPIFQGLLVREEREVYRLSALTPTGQFLQLRGDACNPRATGDEAPPEAGKELFLNLVTQLQLSDGHESQRLPAEPHVRVSAKVAAPSFLVPLLDFHRDAGTPGETVALWMAEYSKALPQAHDVYFGAVDRPIFHAVGHWADTPGDHGYYHYDALTTDFREGGCISHGIVPGKMEARTVSSWGHAEKNRQELVRVVNFLVAASRKQRSAAAPRTIGDRR